MGVTKHEKSFVDYERPYEQNLIGLKGIAYFGIGLLLLIIVTFALMWALLYVILPDSVPDTSAADNPMMMTDKERLPPEPRLQTAPGFGVESQNGRTNLELQAPQLEYWELKTQWQNIWENGLKDPKTGTIISLPIEEAKEKFIGQNVKARSGEDAEKQGSASRMIVTDSSSGRVASEKRR